MTKWKLRYDVVRIEVAIANQEILGVHDGAVCTREVSVIGIVGVAFRERFGEMLTGWHLEMQARSDGRGNAVGRIPVRHD